MMNASKLTGQAGHSSNPSFVENNALDAMHEGECSETHDISSSSSKKRLPQTPGFLSSITPPFELRLLAFHGGDNPNEFAAVVNGNLT